MAPLRQFKAITIGHISEYQPEEIIIDDITATDKRNTVNGELHNTIRPRADRTINYSTIRDYQPCYIADTATFVHDSVLHIQQLACNPAVHTQQLLCMTLYSIYSNHIWITLHCTYSTHTWITLYYTYSTHTWITLYYTYSTHIWITLYYTYSTHIWITLHCTYSNFHSVLYETNHKQLNGRPNNPNPENKQQKNFIKITAPMIDNRKYRTHHSIFANITKP
jgi:hypothetical protein